MYSYNERIKELRKKLGKTQSQMAEEIGVSVDLISKIEQGQRSLSMSMLVLLAEYFDVSTDYILKGADTDFLIELGDLFSYIPDSDKPKVKKIIKSILVNWFD